MMDVAIFIFQAFWFILPAYIGNIAPIFVKWIPHSDAPVDFGRSWKGKRLFGDHKTWRGIIVGVVAGGLVSLLQQRGLAVGIVIASGNFFGDLIGAFIKRRINLEPGEKNLFIDAVPSQICAILAAYMFRLLTISWGQSLFLVAGIIPLHLTANRLWFTLHLKKSPW